MFTRTVSPSCCKEKWYVKLLVPLASLAVALAFGFVLMFVMAWKALRLGGEAVSFSAIFEMTWQSFRILLAGAFYEKVNIHHSGEHMLFLRMAPVVVTTLSFGIAYRRGVINFGISGQYLMGALASFWISATFYWPWWACTLMAALFGAVWAMIPAMFRILFRTGEALISIMCNWIAMYVFMLCANKIMYNPLTTQFDTIEALSPKSVMPTFHMIVNGEEYFLLHGNAGCSILIAVGIVILVWVLEKFVFRKKPVVSYAENRSIAQYFPNDARKDMVLTFLFSGVLAGIGGALKYLPGYISWNGVFEHYAPISVGFVAVLASATVGFSTLGSVVGAFVYQQLNIGAFSMSGKDFPGDVGTVLFTVMSLLCICSYAVIRKRRIKVQQEVESPSVQEHMTDTELEIS